MLTGMYDALSLETHLSNTLPVELPDLEGSVLIASFRYEPFVGKLSGLLAAPTILSALDVRYTYCSFGRFAKLIVLNPTFSRLKVCSFAQLEIFKVVKDTTLSGFMGQVLPSPTTYGETISSSLIDDVIGGAPQIYLVLDK